MTPAPPRWPKWILESVYSTKSIDADKELKAFEIAWAALHFYAQTHEGAEARKAQRAIRRLSK